MLAVSSNAKTRNTKNMKTSFVLSLLSFLCCILPFALGSLFCYLGNGTLEAAFLLSAFITFPLASFLLDASLDSEAGRKIYQNQKVGGIRFMRLGRLSFSFSVSQGKQVPQVNPSVESQPKFPYAGATNLLTQI
jgi:hypothetical protein